MKEEVEKLLENIDNLAKETFENKEKLKDFLISLSKMYNISSSNILLLKSQKEDVSHIFSKKDLEKLRINIKENEKPLKVIKRVKKENGYEFITDEVFDIKQTDAEEVKDKIYTKDYIDTMLKGMCSRRGLIFTPNDQISNIESIIMNIKDNCRKDNSSNFNIDDYIRQVSIEIRATMFAVAKKLKINTRNYNFDGICEWGIQTDSRTIKESLRYMQKYTNYFVRDLEIQEKIQKIEQEKNEENEME